MYIVNDRQTKFVTNLYYAEESILRVAEQQHTRALKLTCIAFYYTKCETSIYTHTYGTVLTSRYSLSYEYACERETVEHASEWCNLSVINLQHS